MIVRPLAQLGVQFPKTKLNTTSTAAELVEYHPGRAGVHGVVPKEPADRIGRAIHVVDAIILNLDRHIDPRLWRCFTQLPQNLCVQPLPLLLLGLIDHGDFSVYLRCRSAASSARSTLLGEAGWHRADFAEARTLDDGLTLCRQLGECKIQPNATTCCPCGSGWPRRSASG